MSDEIKFTGVPKRKPLKMGTVQTVDIQTGEVTEEKRNAMTLLPPGPGVCPECAVDHPHDQPHNQQSMYYQFAFRGTHGRWPTWRDALAHCAPEIRGHWEQELRKRGAWPEDDTPGASR